MAGFAAAVPYLGTAVGAIGSIASAKGQKDQGKAGQQQAQQSAAQAKVSAEFEAKQADYLAGQAVAISQREAYEQRRMSALLASKALSIAAASGAGASDPTVVGLIGEIYAEGAYRSALAMYEGEETARSYKVSAAARRAGGESFAAARTAEGESIARASNLSATSTLISGASSLFGSFGSMGGGGSRSGPYIAPGQATARGGYRG